MQTGWRKIGPGAQRASAEHGTLACLTAFGGDEAMDRGGGFEFEPFWRDFEEALDLSFPPDLFRSNPL